MIGKGMEHFSLSSLFPGTKKVEKVVWFSSSERAISWFLEVVLQRGLLELEVYKSGDIKFKNGRGNKAFFLLKYFTTNGIFKLTLDFKLVWMFGNWYKRLEEVAGWKDQQWLGVPGLIQISEPGEATLEIHTSSLPLIVHFLERWSS